MKTKKLLLALAPIIMAGCAQNEIIESAPSIDRAIKFDVYTGVQTKGLEMTTTSIQTLNFGIFAYKTTTAGWDSEGTSTTPDGMYNEKATHSASGWGYTNTKYWPTNGDKISFFAYAPYDDISTDKGIELSPRTQQGAPEITFTQNTAAADLVDLVVAEAKDKTYDASASNTDDNKVSFTFNHILTKIDVKAKLTSALDGNTKIFITGLKLKSDGKLYKKATYKMSDGKWYYETTGSKAEAWGNGGSLDLDGILDKSNTATWNYSASQGKELTTTAATVFSTSGTQHFLYMIPVRDAETTPGIENKGDAKLEVTYDIVVKVTDSSYASSTTTKEVNLPAGAFKKGTFTTYTLKIGLNAIELGNVEVSTTWASGTDTELEVK